MNALLLPENTEFHVHLGDAIPHLGIEMPPRSVDMAIMSVPFPSVYSYTSLEADLGNSEELKHEAKLHFSFFFRALLRVMKPGRVAMIHCQQIVRMKRSGGEGMYDFRGLLIRLAQRAGFIYDYDWLISKNPQSQAIRTRSRQLQFAGLESDRTKCRGAMGDYMIKLYAPGENEVPVKGMNQVSRNDWIAWAESCWDDIRETDTLNVIEARSETDTRHICPLQLSLINRLIRLYTNPGEIVHDSFTGSGSSGYEALKLGRRFYGTEIKPEYHAATIKNMGRAIAQRAEKSRGLFDLAPTEPAITAA